MQFKDSTYWKRAWVIQEVALANRVFVMAGAERRDLPEVVEKLQRIGADLVTEEKTGKMSMLGITFRNTRFNPTSWRDYKDRSLIELS